MMANTISPLATSSSLATSAAAQIRRPAPAVDDAKIWDAAHKFESMAIGELLKPMFDTVDLAHSAFGGGSAEATWQPMLVDAIAKQMSGAGGIGLASAIHDALLRQQEQTTER
jgi:Rod binding domain-containing protein